MPSSKKNDFTIDLPTGASMLPSRQPLQTLPPAPLNKRPSQPAPHASPLDSISTLKSIEPITPPSTPVRPRYNRSSISEGSITLGSVVEEELNSQSRDIEGSKEATAGIEPDWHGTKPRPYTGLYKIQNTSSSRPAEYGRGVWSVVYRAHTIPVPSAILPTPPTSPVINPPTRLTPSVLAIKSPSRRDANKILYHEARILTFLHSFSNLSKYLVFFHGFDTPTHSIILEPLPLTLDSYVKDAAGSARATMSTNTMFDPVIGCIEWSKLAKQLIAGLVLLHAHQCIHGDIKPANILFRLNSSGIHEPVYCDFSSSLHLSDPCPTEITALTPDYAAPELLLSLTTRGVRTIPTVAADVYALGVTLLFAAIGASPYASARMEMMKLSMAKEGRPVDFARGEDQGARVRRGGLVDKCLVGAVRKESQRWTVEEWAIEVETAIKEKDLLDNH